MTPAAAVLESAAAEKRGLGLLQIGVQIGFGADLLQARLLLSLQKSQAHVSRGCRYSQDSGGWGPQ